MRVLSPAIGVALRKFTAALEGVVGEQGLRSPTAEVLQLLSGTVDTSSLRFCSLLNSLITVASPASAASRASRLWLCWAAPRLPRVARVTRAAEPSITPSTTSRMAVSENPC